MSDDWESYAKKVEHDLRTRIAELEADLECEKVFAAGLLDRNKELEAENQRLRAGLQQVVAYYDSYGDSAKVCADIAKEALENE